MIRISLTQDEEYLLRAHFRRSPIELIRSKALAVRMRSEGMRLSQIGMYVGRSERTIGRWIKDFSQRRISSIFSGKINNENASKLTREQKQQIREVLRQPPSRYGLPKEFWDVPLLKTYVKAEFGVVYESVQSYHFLLKFSNLSFKYPDVYTYQRDEQLIKQRMKQIRREVKEYLQEKSWEVFTGDETRIVLEALTRRAWLKRGERTVIKVKREREYQNYFGVLNQKSFKCHVYEISWQKQEEIIKALEKLLAEYPSKNICIIWDNARFHKGKKIKEQLKRGGKLERVHLISLPPYAPDTNPTEQVWNSVKEKMANKQFDDFKKTKERFVKLIASQKFPYQI